jgi:predicted membrane-bound dolichyl-phosphate-mannose-protein mannosyltransferase
MLSAPDSRRTPPLAAVAATSAIYRSTGCVDLIDAVAGFFVSLFARFSILLRTVICIIKV